MPLGSRIQAIRGLITAHKTKPIDGKPKTDTLQENQPAGEKSMALIDPPHSLSGLTAYPTPYIVGSAGSGGAAGIYGYQSATNAIPATYTISVPPGGNYIQQGQAVYSPGVLYGAQSPSPAWFTGTGQPVQWGGVDLADAPPVLQGRSEFTEEEIERAEQIMEELGA